MAMGIPATRIGTAGYGSSRPIAGNGTEEGRFPEPSCAKLRSPAIAGL